MRSTPKFTIVYDHALRRLSWIIVGFWEMADVAAFSVALRTTMAPLGTPPIRLDSLCDAREFPVQAQDVAEALGAIQRAGEAICKGRSAVVVASMINKLQVQRALGAGIRTFTNMHEAERWLDEAPV